MLDTKELIYASFTHTFGHFLPQHKLTKEELASFLGPSLKQSFANYFDERKIEEVIAYHRAWELDPKHHERYVKEVPHVKETLEYLKKHDYDMGIVSNKLQSIIQMELQQFGLASYFEVIIGSEDVEKTKPSPMGILKACELLHRSHDDIVYIGDTTSDIKTCKHMGAFSIAFILEEARANEMIKEKPCMFITDMKEFIGIVKEEREWSDVTI